MPNMLCRDVTLCRCCASPDLTCYLDLGEQPLANGYHHGECLPAYPLKLALCGRCFHSQLTVVVDPKSLFTEYLYVSGTTNTLRAHFQGLAADTLARAGHDRPAVLDIACNDGTLLECFRAAGARVSGVDPAGNLRPLTAEKGIDVVTDFWSAEVAAALDPVDVITATNVFAHVDDAQSFLSACRACLRPSGLVALEFPYCRRMILENEFDTIYHEHLSYFLLGPVVGLAERLGFQVEDLSFWPIHGGSVRLILRDARAGPGPAVAAALARERAEGFDTMVPYQRFAWRVERNRQRLRELVDELSRGQKRVVGYGASAKGNTMLNYCQLNLPYVVDDNPMKWGWLTPGRNIPIQSPGTLAEEPEPLHLLLLAWNFAAEIFGRVKKIRPGQTDYALTYVPEVGCHAIDGDHARLE